MECRDDPTPVECRDDRTAVQGGTAKKCPGPTHPFFQIQPSRGGGDMPHYVTESDTLSK